MQRNIKNTLMNKILLGLLSWLIWTAAQAAGPLWTILPAPGSNPTQIVPASSTSTVQYIVQNQSGKSKRLVIAPIPGIIQTVPCLLAPKGQVGSSCTLNLAINGSTLLKSGVHGGPALCQANPDGSPNPNQCYQPSAAHILNITKGVVNKAGIAVSPAALDLVTGSGTPGFLTITNNSTSITAQNVGATLPASWTDVTQDAGNCVAIAPNGGSCQLQFIPGATAHAAETVPIVGSNTTLVTAQLSVSEPAQASLLVTGGPLSLVAGCPTAGVLAVENTSMTAAADIAIDLLSLVNDVDVVNNCPNLLPAGQSCFIELKGVNPHAASTISIQGSNTPPVFNSVGVEAALTIGDNYLGGIVFEVSNCNIGKVVTGLPQDSNELISQWSGVTNNDVTTAVTDNSGASNTNNIIAQDPPACDSLSNCAAYQCRNLNGPTPDWYLPALDELVQVAQALCPTGTTCAYGSFSYVNYWSSSQADNINFARQVDFPTGEASYVTSKNGSYSVRCVRAFTS